MSDAAYGIAITADDKTAKGVKSAEKRLGQIPKHVSAVNRRALEADEARTRRSGRSIVRTFGAVEQAGARLLGNRSITAGAAGRLGEVRAAASALGTGLGEASAGAGMVGGALGAVGVVAGATVGILAAAAYGAFKLADGWAKGAASIGRTAAIMGVATKALQEFTAAGERVGVDKATGAGALGDLNQTLNDARYGRNQEAVAVLARMGVRMKLNKDGTVDTAAMLPAIADALARQNSSGRRTAGRILGISEAALPAFTQGGKALSADMADAAKTAPIVSDQDVAVGQRIERKSVRIGQMKDRAMLGAGAAAAGVAEKGYDATLAGGRAILDGSKTFDRSVRDTFKPAAERIDRAAGKLQDAADRFGASLTRGAGGAGRLSRAGVIAKARQGIALRHKLVAAGFSPNDATALAANAAMESNANYRARERGGGGVGLFQWTNRKRKADFRRVMGVDVEASSEAQQIAFLKWELQNTERHKWALAHRGGDDPASVAAGFARHVERPANIARDSSERAAVASAMSIQLEIRGLPKGASAHAVGGRGPKPAISHAVAH